MITGGASRRLSHLWQLPLLLLSLIVSASAAYLFLDARPVITLNQKLAPARELLRNDRPDAAMESLTRLVTAEKLPRDGEAQVHLLLGEALEAQQKQSPTRVPAALTRVIEETQIALAQGIKPTGEIHRRLGESYEALGKPIDAVSQYRQAIVMDPPRALRLQRKVINLQLATSDWAPAETSLDAYLASPGISSAERAWAIGEKAQLLVDRNECLDARRLLEDALRLAPDPLAQAEARCRLGVCAWKLGSSDEAEKLLKSARGEFKGQHPLDAQAAFVLGAIRQEKNDLAAAIALFDAALAAKPDDQTAALAHFRRGECRSLSGDDVAAAVADFKAATDDAKSAPQLLKDQLLASLRKTSGLLAGKGNLQAAIELLNCEPIVSANLPATFHGRLASAYEKRADQVEQSIADAPSAEQVRRQQLARDFRIKAAEANLALSRALAAAGDAGHVEPLWKALDLFERASARESVVAALEVFISERTTDPQSAAALLRLGTTYESLNQPDKAVLAYERLQGAFRKSAAAAQSAPALAALYHAKGPEFQRSAEKLLASVVDDANVPPDSDAKRAALLALGRMYHESGNFRDALPRLEQFASKYATDDRAPETIFLAAECNAQLAQQVDVRLASATVSAENGGGADEMARAAGTKKQQLLKASEGYDRVREIFRSRPPTQDVDRRCLRLSLLRRADCSYELGNYVEAIGLYEQAAKESDVAQALAAHVQVANAYFALGKPQDARAANERAKSLLHQLPQGALADGTIPMPRAYLEQWLKWSGVAGSW